jgi:hypothetical protein
MPSTPESFFPASSSPRQLSGGRLRKALSDICFRNRALPRARRAMSARSISASRDSPQSARKSKKMLAASRLEGSPRSIHPANAACHSGRLAHHRGFIAITPPLQSG